ncbi:hypothetical protein [Kocuria marina]|uniref:hypothetical protein n=1 Tax=Kocuria marina TaxID=223184 RepID=UPI00345FD783
MNEMENIQTSQPIQAITQPKIYGCNYSEAARIIAKESKWTFDEYKGICDADGKSIAKGFEELGLAARELGLFISELHPSCVDGFAREKFKNSMATADRLREQIATHGGEDWYTWDSLSG